MVFGKTIIKYDKKDIANFLDCIVKLADEYELDVIPSALFLFNALFKINIPIPVIAPDDDNGLMAVWEIDNNLTMLGIYKSELYFVAHATTSKAEYFDGLIFDGVNIPKELIDAIKNVKKINYGVNYES